jgi:hypothetical protein
MILLTGQGHGEVARVAEQLQPVVLAEAVVDEADVERFGGDGALRLVERRDPLQLERGAARVGEQRAREDVVVLIVLDEQEPDGTGIGPR